jgi:hypothetical protein
MSAINVNSITGRTGSHGPVLTGVTTVTGGTLNTASLNVTGVTTTVGLLDVNGNLDVDGHTELDDVNVSGASTFANVSISGAFNSDSNVGIQTTFPTSSTLVGAASSLIGLYIGDGHLLFSDNLSRPGGYYIPNGLNALNAGPVTLGSTMTLDGVWVIV